MNIMRDAFQKRAQVISNIVRYKRLHRTQRKTYIEHEETDRGSPKSREARRIQLPQDSDNVCSQLHNYLRQALSSTREDNIPELQLPSPVQTTSKETRLSASGCH